jgi:hypothetical protein
MNTCITKENIQTIDQYFYYDLQAECICVRGEFFIDIDLLNEMAEEPVHDDNFSDLEEVLNYCVFEEAIGENKVTVFDDDFNEDFCGGYSNKYNATFVCKVTGVNGKKVFFEILIEEHELVR